jgi:hypothetical protein
LRAGARTFCLASMRDSYFAATTPPSTTSFERQ